MPLLAGLLEEAKVTPQDTLVGLGDGAAWIGKLFDHLHILSITDVYYTSERLDPIIQVLRWDTATRTLNRFPLVG